MNSLLTICSVSFHSAPYLTLNWELTKQLNGGTDSCKWIVVENTPDGADRKLRFEDARFVVMPGVDVPKMSKGRGSYQHGAALNKAIAFVKTRFILVLDPDFFIVRKNWIDEVIDHMISNGLAFFGTPWHPRCYRKYRYFPCVHCLFIDLNRITLSDIDFMPNIFPSFISKLWARHEQLMAKEQRILAWWTILRHPTRALVDDIKQRLLIGSSRDTGYYLYLRYAKHSQVKHENIKPVFRPTTENFIPSGVSRLQRSRFMELLLFDSMSYIPKRKDYFTGTGFRELGYTDVFSSGWEEFIWKNQPFGFHIRSNLQRAYDSKRNDTLLFHILESLTGLKLRGQSVSRQARRAT